MNRPSFGRYVDSNPNETKETYGARRTELQSAAEPVVEHIKKVFAEIQRKADAPPEEEGEDDDEEEEEADEWGEDGEEEKLPDDEHDEF